MTRISAIAARDNRGVIGREGSLPWRLPADSKHFRRVTLGRAVIMGRCTWESLPGPLNDRYNIVVSRQRLSLPAGVALAHGLDNALELASAQGVQPVIIGGASLYAESLERGLLQELHLTEVDAAVVGDTWFPEFEVACWREVQRSQHLADEVNEYACTFRELHFVGSATDNGPASA